MALVELRWTFRSGYVKISWCMPRSGQVGALCVILLAAVSVGLLVRGGYMSLVLYVPDFGWAPVSRLFMDLASAEYGTVPSWSVT